MAANMRTILLLKFYCFDLYNVDDKNSGNYGFSGQQGSVAVPINNTMRNTTLWYVSFHKTSHHR